MARVMSAEDVQAVREMFPDAEVAVVLKETIRETLAGEAPMD